SHTRGHPEERRGEVAGVARPRYVIQHVLRLDEELHALSAAAIAATAAGAAEALAAPADGGVDAVQREPTAQIQVQPPRRIAAKGVAGHAFRPVIEGAVVV